MATHRKPRRMPAQLLAPFVQLGRWAVELWGDLTRAEAEDRPTRFYTGVMVVVVALIVLAWAVGW